jgi:hypothetical protein
MFKDGRKNVYNEDQVVGLPSVMSYDPVQSVDQQFCERCHSQFQNFSVNFQKFHALFSTRLSQLGRLSQLPRKMGSENAHECAQNIRGIPQRWRRISQSHRTDNR